MSTAAEIQQAKEEEKQVLSQYNVVSDPLLEPVGQRRLRTGSGAKSRGATCRTTSRSSTRADINSFTIGGGYVYVNEGLLDFVQSDDELAGVIGHETGHNERRHAVTLPAKAQALNLLFGIASLFSPFIYRFGQLARGRADRETVARRRTPGRPVRTAADDARRLRSRCDGVVHEAPRRGASRSR